MSHSPRLFGSEANKPSSRADAEVLDRWARATDTELGRRDIKHLDRSQQIGNSWKGNIKANSWKSWKFMENQSSTWETYGNLETGDVKWTVEWFKKWIYSKIFCKALKTAFLLWRSWRPPSKAMLGGRVTPSQRSRRNVLTVCAVALLNLCFCASLSPS